MDSFYFFSHFADSILQRLQFIFYYPPYLIGIYFKIMMRNYVP